MRAEAVRVFNLADSGKRGVLDVRQLARMLGSEKAATARMRNIDRDRDGVISKEEWLTYVQGIYDQHPPAAAKLLESCEMAVSDSPIHDEALRVFKRLNSNGKINMKKLTAGTRGDETTKAYTRHLAGKYCDLEVDEKSWLVCISRCYAKSPDGTTDFLHWCEQNADRIALAAEAEHIFKLSTHSKGRRFIDKDELHEALQHDDMFPEMWTGTSNVSPNTQLGKDDWLEHIHSMHRQNPAAATVMMKAYKRHVCEFPLYAEAVRVFKLAVDGKDMIDREELAAAQRNHVSSDEICAIGQLSDKIDVAEWVAHIKFIYHKDQEAAAATLKACEARAWKRHLESAAKRAAEMSGGGALDVDALIHLLKSEGFAEAVKVHAATGKGSEDAETQLPSSTDLGLESSESLHFDVDDTSEATARSAHCVSLLLDDSASFCSATGAMHNVTAQPLPRSRWARAKGGLSRSTHGAAKLLQESWAEDGCMISKV